MIAYAEKTTQELIDLLISEEDRVMLDHIQVLVARSDATEPLQRLLQNDYYWYDADLKESWSLYHAFIVLCLKRDQEALPILLDSLKKAHETDYDYLTEMSHAALAHYGESAVDVLMEFVKELKGKHEDDWVMTYPRSDAVTALSRIAFENPAVHSRIADFVFGLLIDKAETDSDFLSFICDDAVLLDRERGLAAVQAAYEHGLIDDSINGDFEFFKQDIDSGNNVTESKYRRDVFDFYRPEEIASRQKQWQQAAENLKRLQAEKEIRVAKTTNRDNWFAEEVERGLPAGFTVTEAGNFVREEKIGRNDPCSCGSGKKYKKCHGK